MGLGRKRKPDPRIRLLLRNGNVERYRRNGRKTCYGYVEGTIEDIYIRIRNYNGERAKNWFMDMRGENGKLYSIRFPYGSGTFRSIILSLASDDTLTASTTVRIETYPKGFYTNVKVWIDSVKLDWVICELPPVRTINVDGQEVKDDSERTALVVGYVNQILNKLQRSGK